MPRALERLGDSFSLRRDGSRRGDSWDVDVKAWTDGLRWPLQRRMALWGGGFEERWRIFVAAFGVSGDGE